MNNRSQLGSTLSLILSIIILVFIFLFFLIIANIPGISRHESSLVNENIQEYLVNDEIAKTNFALVVSTSPTPLENHLIHLNNYLKEWQDKR